jgi:hypothetical protein
VIDNRLLEASNYIYKNHYNNLQGVRCYAHPANAKIKAVFVGVTDPTMSNLIYKGINGDLPYHTFNEHDLNNLSLWVGFGDNTVLPLEEILQSDNLKKLCVEGALQKTVHLTTDWSESLIVPDGLSIRITPKNEMIINSKIYNPHTPKVTEHKKEVIEGNVFWFKYWHEYTGLPEMINPSIAFKVEGRLNSAGEIFVEFLDE